MGPWTAGATALGVAATVFLGSALPGAAEEPEPDPDMLELAVSAAEVEGGKPLVVSSISPCRDAAHPEAVTEVEIAIVYGDAGTVASDTFTAYAPDDPARDGNWSWTYIPPVKGQPGTHTVVASCWASDPGSATQARWLVGEYDKVDFSVWLDGGMNEPDPVGPPQPDPQAPPIGSGYAEISAPRTSPPEATEVPAPPPATAVLARPDFAG